jgi:type II secretory ATPase GspE/PulE/Tfp pilus assembly ATPase PilB-like protein
MVKAAIKVCIRTRPTPDFADGRIHLDTDRKTILVQTSPQDEDNLPHLSNKQNQYKFKFDDIFHYCSQSDIYDHRARETVLAVVEGVNGSIMTYGQTGSGKTFTMVLKNLS